MAECLLALLTATASGLQAQPTEAQRKDVHALQLKAQAGSAEARNRLGVMYATGAGVGKDMGEAVKWFRLAAEQGLAEAQNNLGALYHTGNGVAKDLGEAARWYRLAAEQGHAPAQHNLGLMYASGIGVEKDAVTAVRWYRLAAEQGNALAQSHLGSMYARGTGVSVDLVEAYAWLNLAARTEEVAAKNRAHLEKRMPAPQVAEGQRRTQELRLLIEAKLKPSPRGKAAPGTTDTYGHSLRPS